MPLSELVLDFRTGQEIRLTDQPVAVGDTFQMHSTFWEIVGELPRIDHDRPRFQCRKATAMRDSDGEIRERTEQTKQRFEALRRRLDP